MSIPKNNKDVNKVTHYFNQFSNVRTTDIEKKYLQLKSKLDNNNYTLPLGYDSLALVDKLLSDVIQSRNDNFKLQEANNKMMEDKQSELAIGNPLRNQNLNLFNENKLLHEEIEKIRNECINKVKVSELACKSLNDKILEVKHLLQEKDFKIKDLEIENSKTVKKLSDVLDKIYGKQGGLENVDKIIKSEIPFFVKKQEFVMTMNPIPKKLKKNMENNLVTKEEWANDIRAIELRCDKFRELNKELEKKKEELMETQMELDSKLKKKEDELRKFYENYAPVDEIKFKYELENQKKMIEKLNKQNDIVNQENHKLKEENHIHKHRCYFDEIKKLDKEIIRLKKEIEALKSSENQTSSKSDSKTDKNELSGNLVSQINLLNQKCKILEDDNTDLQHKNKELSQLSKELSEEYERKTSEMISLNNSEKRLMQEKIKSISTEISKLNSSLEEKSKIELLLKNEIDKLKAENNIIRGKDIMLLQDMQEKTNNVDSIYNELNLQLKHNSEMRSKMTELENLNSDLEKRLREALRENDSKIREINLLKEENLSLNENLSNNKNNNLRDGMEKDKFATTNKLNEAKIRNLETEKNALEGILSKKNQLLTDLENERSLLKKNVNDKELIISSLQSEYKILSEEFKGQLDENKTLEENLRIEKSKNSSIHQNNVSKTKIENLESTIKQYSQDKINLQAEKNALENRLEDMKLNLENTQTLKIDLEKRYDDLFNKHQEEIKSLNQENLDLKYKVATNDKYSTEETIKMNSNKKEIKDLMDKLNSTKNQLEDLKGEKVLFEFEIKKHLLEKSNLNETISSLKINIEEKNSELRFLNETLMKLKSQMNESGALSSNKTSEEILILHQKIGEEKAENEKLQYINKEYSDRKNLLEKELALSSQQINKLKDTIDDIKKSKEEIFSKLNEEIAKRRKIESQHEYNSDTEKILSDQLQLLKTQNDELKFSLNTLSGKYDMINDELDIKTNDISRLTSELETSRKINLDINSKFNNQIERHQADYKRLNERENLIREMQIQIGSLEKKKEDLNSKVNELSRENKLIKEDLENVIGQNSILNDELNEFKNKCQKAELTVGNMNLNNEFFLNKIQTLENDNQDLTQHYQKALIENTKTKKKLDLFVEENKAAAEHIAILANKSNEYEAYIKKVNDEIDNLNKKIESLDNYSNSVNNENLKLKEMLKKFNVDLKDMNNNMNVNKEINLNYENHILELKKRINKIEIDKTELTNQLSSTKMKLESLSESKNNNEKKLIQLENLLQEERKQNFSMAKLVESLKNENNSYKQNNMLLNNNVMISSESEKENNVVNKVQDNNNKDIDELKNYVMYLKSTNEDLENALKFAREDNLRLSKRGDKSSFLDNMSNSSNFK